jgi:hypothetical protein
MLAVEFLTWWYGAGWRQLISRILKRIEWIIEIFSIPILLRTLFEPWRRIISYGDDSFIAGLRAMLDNTISRFVGLGVRLIVLFTAFIGMMLTLLGGIILVVVWPLMPLGSIAMILWGLLP